MGKAEDAEIRDILAGIKSIAVVGLSDKPDRPSYHVASFLKSKGYVVIPVNPAKEEILDRKCFASLEEIPEKIDAVVVFRRSEDTVPVAMSAAKTKAKVLWLQLGIKNDEARRIAEKAGLKVVMDRCMAIEHGRLM
ncbi:MAG: CoA-binding protein [Candidatus Eisenbacteria bacterium]|nr:CoA-binding protein [Candidatus Eisenbacteria bacterium]